MNLEMKKLAFALICITSASTAMAAAPTNTPPTTKPGTSITTLAPPTVTGIKAPVEIFVGDVLDFTVEGTGMCEYSLDIGNGFVGKQKLQLPVKGSVITQYKVGADENYHTYTVTVTPAGKCKSDGPITASIKVKKFADNTADSPTNPPVVKDKAKPTGGIITFIPATLLGIGPSISTAPSAKLLFNVTGTGSCKFHLTYMKNEPPLVATPMLTFSSAAPKKFPLTLEMPKPTLPGTYTYTASAIEGCIGSHDTTITVK